MTDFQIKAVFIQQLVEKLPCLLKSIGIQQTTNVLQLYPLALFLNRLHPFQQTAGLLVSPFVAIHICQAQQGVRIGFFLTKHCLKPLACIMISTSLQLHHSHGPLQMDIFGSNLNSLTQDVIGFLMLIVGHQEQGIAVDGIAPAWLGSESSLIFTDHFIVVA